MTYRFASSKVAYTLAWPREVLAYELDWVLKTPQQGPHTAAELLIEEAFVSQEPLDEFKALTHTQWGGAAPTAEGQAMLQRLREVVDQLPRRAEPRPYWSQRRQAGKPSVPGKTTTTLEHRRAAWAALVERYRDNGYLDVTAPTDCVDQMADQVDQIDLLEKRTYQMLHRRGSWPLDSDSWDEDTFYSLVEVVGDLIARPRRRWLHDYASCGWHYEQFAVVPGQMLYRTEVNDLLAGTGLELASDGEDAGRLVRTVDDARTDLLQQVLEAPEGPERDEVAHAVSLFRARGADRATKRSAAYGLARILETRRALLHDKLGKKDEGALFHIANEFDIRHRKANQHPDYDEAYLDWIFWWYLATIELSDHLIARDASGAR